MCHCCTLSIYLCIRILKKQNYGNKGILRKGDVFRKPTFNGLYTPFGSPVSGGQKPQERGRKPPSSARNRCAIRLSDHQRSTPYCAGWDRLGYTCELKHLGLWKFAGAVMYVLHEALGLSEEKMIAPMDEKRGKLLLAEILNGGNFGQHFTKYGHFTQQGMAKKYFLKIWRNMHFVRYFPAEALCEPIFRTWHFFWRLKHRR